MSKSVTLNLTIKKMQHLKEIVERDIMECEALCTPSETTEKMLDYKRSILVAIESAIHHAEIE